MNNNENEMERIRQGLEGFLYETEKETAKETAKRRPISPDLRAEAPRHAEAPRPRRQAPRPRTQEVNMDLAGERRQAPRRRPAPQRYPENREVSLDLAEHTQNKPIYVDERAVNKELKEAKKVLKKQKKIAKMKAEAEAYQARKAGGGGGNGGKKPKGGQGGPEGAPKKGKGKRVFIALLTIICLFAVIWCYAMTKIYGKMNYSEIPSFASAGIKDNGVVNVLLIGSDSRDETDEGRSDAMILLSISNSTKTIQMTSFLRDMYVEIPGYEGNRLNAAYAFGGPELLMETITQNFDIKIDRYMVVNFKAFANLVDAVGGVKLELSNDEVKWVNAYLNEYNLLQGLPIDNDYLDETLSGEIQLDGPQALAYSRNRYIGTDFGRTERQRKVLNQVIKKIPGAMVTNPTGIIDGLFPNLTTNVTRGEFIYLSSVAWKLAAYDIEQNMIPLQGTYSDANIRGMAVLQVDFEANKKYLKEKIYNEK
jgi:LCP family protein required for cell wall assembly